VDSGQGCGVDNLIKTTLDGLGVPVERVKFSGEADTFIIFQIIYVQESEHADDTVTANEHLYRVDIFSKSNYMTLLKQAKQALRAAGFYGISVNAEFYENSTGFYRVSLDSYYLEVDLCELV